jgi:hypothetical protein
MQIDGVGTIRPYGQIVALGEGMEVDRSEKQFSNAE